MAGDEEVRARATLVEMQRRLSRGPHAALGVSEAASPHHIRAAFLELTKQFHPARFGRMSYELQRMSNEVFLGIKSAHETMLRALGMPPRSNSALRNQTSGAIPIITAEGSSKMQQSRPASPAPAPTPRAVGTQQPLRSSSPAIPRTLTPARLPSQTVQRNPPPAATGQTPPQGIRTMPVRPGTPPNRPPTPSKEPPPPTERGIGVMPQKTAPVFDEASELKQVFAHISAQDWVKSRQVLNGLAARNPTSKQYRALLCYTRGREAQLAGKGEDAHMEYSRALQLDPDQALAKSALAELLLRR